MSTKSSGSMGGDTAKSSGALEKDPLAAVDADSADAGAYDYSDYGGSSGGGSYEPSYSGGSTGSGTDSGGADVDDAPTDPPADDPADSGDDNAGDTPGEGESPGEADTLPGEHPSPPENGPDDPGPDRPHRVSIDIDLMIVLIAAMERAREQIPELAHQLRTILSDLDLDPSEVSGYDRVTAWIDDELPLLRRRLALAQALEDGDLIIGDPRPQPTPVPLPTPLPAPAVPPPGPDRIVAAPLPKRREVEWHGDFVTAVAPHEAGENGRRAAALLGQPDGTAEAAELIRSHQADPYFAREFASNTDPSFIADAPASTDDAELQALVRSTVATAQRSTGELAIDDAVREAWAGALA